MKYNILLTSILLSPLFYSCINNTSKKKEGTVISTNSAWTLKLPQVPDMMTSSEQRLDFLVKHYWSNLNIADTTLLYNDQALEQAWVDYCDLLRRAPRPTAGTAIRSFIADLDKNPKLFLTFTELADKYLYDPNSPMRDEELYIPVLESMMASSSLDEVGKIRPESRLKLAKRNRLGSKALDFEYTLRSGIQGSLYQIPTEYVILFFNNPGCHACAETTLQLKENELIKKLIEEKRLTILAIYPDKDLAAWKQHTGDLPKEWINGYDKEQVISNKELYDLKAIPTLYLLDKNNIVVLKDAPFSDIINYLYHN